MPVTIETEELVYRNHPADNGAGPLWTYGSPLLARLDSDVLVSTIETDRNVPGFCNTRWQIRRCTASGWSIWRQGDQADQREPCPIGAFPDGTIWLSTNPNADPRRPKYARCTPQLLRFSPAGQMQTFQPPWPLDAVFTDHSYRGMAVDPDAQSVLLLNIDAKEGCYHYALLNDRLEWSALGILRFPIRACYPNLAIRGRSAHVLAIGDIVEPNEAWRAAKHERSGRQWDYVFRRLFYAWTPDIERVPFCEPLEIDNLDATCGYLRNGDVYLTDLNAAHLVFYRQSCQYDFIRDRFFPGLPLERSLEYALVRDGRIAQRRTFLKSDDRSELIGLGDGPRLHATPDGHLRLVALITHGDSDRPQHHLRLQPLWPQPADPQNILLTQPIHLFQTNTPRGGSAAGLTLDLYGGGNDPQDLVYARLRLP